jgi:hypothetical protein
VSPPGWDRPWWTEGPLGRADPCTPRASGYARETMAVPSDRVKQILSFYASDTVGVKNNLLRLLNHGTLGGTGRLVILPVAQGF